ncbi:MAG TPA: MFS transporter [Rhodopila sp.]|uniref:MFS transporter n=1 Tax=Rhodopila sp. TaxID=2480087 RepID=UPI002BB74513|nr:MFS transporter [Rhodopila sp.]HVY17864.1 MFS transporter [Rhodopila sp.]
MDIGLHRNEPLPPAVKRTVLAGCIGFAVDFFDIYLPVLALAPVIRYFEPPGLSPAASTTIYFFTFAATLFGRPCGAVIFGHWADKLGRRRTTMISIAGFGIFTVLIALLPGYATLGVWALVLLIALRFIDGVFMGGEYTSNNMLALEMVPKDRRGFVGGVLQGAFPIGFALVSAVTSFLLGVMTQAQYLAWGWRLAFVFGGVLAFAFLMFYRSVPESEVWMESEKSTAPLKEVFSGDHLRNLIQIFVMMVGFWFASQVNSILPGILIQQLHVPAKLTSDIFLAGSIVLFFGFVGCGLLSQAIGRRPAIVACGLGVLVGGTGLYYLLVNRALAGAPLTETAAVTIAFYILTVSPWGIVTTYISERFPTHVRASGYGIGYSAAVVVPAFAGFYLLGLSHVMPYVYSPLVLLVIAGVLMVMGALMGPETRDMDMRAPAIMGTAEEPAAPRTAAT